MCGVRAEWVGDILFGFLSKYQKRSVPDSSELKRGWLRLPSDGFPVFVFVHGFMSGAGGCWRNASGSTWPEMICGDSRFAGVGVYVTEYHTGIDSGSYDIPQCVGEVYRDLTFQRDGSLPPLSMSSVIFVCHSLGGIVVRSLIEVNLFSLREKSLGLVLLGSPSTGSDYANLLAFASLVYGNKVGLQLRRGSEFLSALDARFKSILHKRFLPGLVGLELVEHHGIVRSKWLPFVRMKPVVTKDSASRYFGEASLVPGTDHKTLVKPESVDDDVYVRLLQFYSENFALQLPVDVSATSVESQIESDRDRCANILFDIYSKKQSEYYFLREVDDRVYRHCGFWSLWIHGPSGVGKTSVVKRLIENLGASPVYIDMGGVQDIGSDEFKRNLIDTVSAVCDVHLDPGSSAMDVASALVSSGRNKGLSIFVDEVPVPLGDGQGSEVVRFLESLVSSLRAKSDNLTKVVLCSINEPSRKLFSEKGLEQIGFVGMKVWSNEEMRGLSVWLTERLKIEAFSDNDVNRLLVAAAGSPRFMKAFYRSYISIGVGAEVSKFDVALDLAVKSRLGS